MSEHLGRDGMSKARGIARTVGVDYQTLAEFRYQLRRFLKRSEDAAREVGLEPQQHQLMLAIKGAPEGAEATIRYLSERLLLKHHSTVELVDRLEAGALVQREQSRDDRRRVCVRLTKKGEALVARLARHNAEMLRGATPLMRALEAINRDEA